MRLSVHAKAVAPDQVWCLNKCVAPSPRSRSLYMRSDCFLRAIDGLVLEANDASRV